MSTLVTPIIDQLELDRDRLNAMVNGAVGDTVQLEGRTEKSIAGQVEETVNNLAVDLNAAVSSAQGFADDAQSEAVNAANSASTATSEKNATAALKSDTQTIHDDTVQLKTDTQAIKDATDTVYNDTVGIKDDTQVIADDLRDSFADVLATSDEPVRPTKRLWPARTDITVPTENLQFIASGFTAFSDSVDLQDREIEVAEVDDADPDNPVYTTVHTANGPHLAFDGSGLGLDTAKIHAWRTRDTYRIIGLDGIKNPNALRGQWSSWTEFAIENGKPQLDRPTLTLNESAAGTPLTPTFNVTASSTTNGAVTVDTTVFVVQSEGRVVYGTSDAGEVTSFSVPAGVLKEGQDYEAHAMYIGTEDVSGDQSISTWADAVTFTTHAMAYKAEIESLQSGKEDKVQVNLSASADPTVNDDTGAGYEPRSIWFNTSSGEAFRCLDASAGAAVWVKTTLTLDELGALASSNDASGVPISDTGGHFAATDVEGALQEEAAARESHEGATNPHGIDATTVNLGNVDNTSDANKPVSTAQQSALDQKRDLSDTHLPTVKTTSQVATADLDMSAASTFRVDGTTSPTLTISNTPASDRSVVVEVFITGNSGTITWPAEVDFDGGADPTLGPTWTRVQLFWSGTMWVGHVIGSN